MTAPARTVHELLRQAITVGIKPSIRECWADFAAWERARGFADDPSHPAKAAIQWVYNLEELRCQLDEFSGPARAECLAALDQADEEFAKLEHSEELVHALETWISYRLSE